MTGRLMGAEEAHSLGLINYLVDADSVIDNSLYFSNFLSHKPAVAWQRTKERLREIALSGFNDAFRAGVLGQQESYAAGEAQAIIDGFMAARAKK